MGSDEYRDALPPALGFRTQGTILTVPEQIADRICAAILGGRFRPGERIQELRLAQLFEVSRGPVREALRILEREGLVTMSPRRGAQVTALSIAEVEQLFDIRAALSSLAAQQAARNIRPGELEALRRTVDAMGRLAEDGGGGTEYVALSSQCSQIVATAARNPRLLAMLLSLWRQTLRYSQLGLGSRERRRESARSWAALAAAVAAGDADRAGAVMARTILLSKAEAVRRLHADAAAGRPGGPGGDGSPAAT